MENVRVGWFPIKALSKRAVSLSSKATQVPSLSQYHWERG
jgi:hypothetical protein